MATWKYLPPPIGVQQGKEDERKPAQKTQWKYLPPPIGVETKPIEQKKTPAKTISTLARKETALAPRIPIAQPSARRTAQPGQGYFGVPAGTSIATAIPQTPIQRTAPTLKPVHDIAKSFLQGVYGTVGLTPLVQKHIGDKTLAPQAAKYDPRELLKPPESPTFGQKAGHFAGVLAPYIAAGALLAPITPAVGGALVGKVAPKAAQTIARVAGRGAVGATVSGIRETIKGLTSPDEFEAKQAALNVVEETGRFAAFALAASGLGEPVRMKVLGALRESMGKGVVTWNLANVISAVAGSLPTASVMAALNTTLNYMRNPEEFDKAQAKKDAVSTLLFYVGMDLFFTLKNLASPSAWKGWTKGEAPIQPPTPQPTKNAEPLAGFKNDLTGRGVFMSGTFNPAQQGYQELKGMGVWIKPGTGSQLQEMVQVGEWVIPKWDAVRSGISAGQPTAPVQPAQGVPAVQAQLLAPVPQAPAQPIHALAPQAPAVVAGVPEVVKTAKPAAVTPPTVAPKAAVTPEPADVLEGIPVAPKGYLPGLEDVSREKVTPEQPLIKRGQRSVNFNRGGTVQSQSRGGTFVGEHFVTLDTATIAYAQTDKTYGVYDKTGNQIKGGFDKASEAIEYAKALYSLAPSEAKEAPKVAAPAPAVPVAKEPFNEVNHAKSVLATAQIGGQNIIGRKNFVEALKTLQKNGLIPKDVDVKGLSAERAEMWVQQVEHQTFEKTLKQKGFADLDEAQLAFDAKKTPFDKWQDDNAWSLQGVKAPQEYYKKLAEKVAALSPQEQKQLKMDLQMFADAEREKLRRQMFAIANKRKLSREQRLEIARGIAKNPELASTTELTSAQLKEAVTFMNQYGTKMSPARKKLVSETQVQQLFTDAETEVKEAEFKINRSRELGYEVAMASDVYKVLGTTPPEGFMDVPIGHYWGGTKMFIPRDLDIKDISAKDIRMLEKQPNIFDYIRPFYRTLPQPLVDEVTTGRRQADRFANDYSKILDDMTKGLNEKQRVEVAAMLEGIVPQEGKMGEVARAVKDKFFDPLFEKAVSAGVLDQEQYVSNYFSRISDKMKKVTGETFCTPERWFTKGRTGRLAEYKKDVREVGFIYTRALSKAMYIDPVQKKWEPVISKMPSRRKGLATEFLTIAAGRPGTEEALVNQFVTDMFRAIGKDVEGRHAQDVSRALTSIIVQKLMGMNPGSMLKNYTQQILPAADVAGKGADRLRGFKYLVDSKRMLATKAGQDFVKQYCILLDQRVYHEGLQKISHLENKLDKLLDKSSKITMFGFQAADINNVKTAFLIGYQAAIKDGKSVTDAIAYANDVALRTQFPYDIRRAPVYNGPLGRLIGLFSSYPQHFVELTSDWAISDHKLRALIAMAGLFGVVSLFRRLGLVVRVNVWDTIQGHLLWKTAKGEPGAFKSSIDDFNKFAGKLMSGDYESWLEAVEDAYYVLGPGSTQLKRIDKIKQAAKDGWRVRNAKGRVMYRFEIGDTMLDNKIYEITGIPGEAWRSLFGQTVESEERWKEKQKPSIFEKLGSKVKEKAGGR